MHYIYLPSGNPDATTLLLLHGTGGDERDLLPFIKYFGDGFNVLSLRGNVLENGMPRFFRRIGMGVFDEEDLTFRTHELVAFVQKIAVEQNFDAGKIVTLGYSNGANIAGAVLNMYPDWLTGAILLRAMRPFRDKPFERNKKQTPVFLSSGLADPTVSSNDTEHYIALLDRAGFQTTHYALPTGHNLTSQDLQLASEWLQKTVIS